MTEDVSAQQMFETLSRAPVENYEPMDRYRDFRAVFLATDQGTRVLCEILKLAGMNKSIPPGPIDPNRTHVSEGRRSMGNSIMGIIHNEPPIERPTQTNKE